jgi:Zn-dependent alcohol dehydrogenase
MWFVTDMFLQLSNLSQAVYGRVARLEGIKGRTQLPDLVADYMDGKLKVDEFITHRQPLANINTAFHDMHSGDCVRHHTCPLWSMSPLLTMDHNRFAV